MFGVGVKEKNDKLGNSCLAQKASSDSANSANYSYGIYTITVIFYQQTIIVFGI